MSKTIKEVSVTEVSTEVTPTVTPEMIQEIQARLQALTAKASANVTESDSPEVAAFKLTDTYLRETLPGKKAAAVKKFRYENDSVYKAEQDQVRHEAAIKAGAKRKETKSREQAETLSAITQANELMLKMYQAMNQAKG